jgi:SsrA-binding protein
MQVVARNKRARYDYSVEETLEAGLELLGSEVKGMRQGAANLSDAYAVPRGTELYLLNTRIGPYERATAFTHEPTRSRRLLLHRSEIDRWTAKVRERGYSIIPLMLYFKAGRAKVELGLCRGKTHEDRRADIKEREERREIERALRRR